MFDKYAGSLDTCEACPSLCQSVCPVFASSGNKSASPWGLMQLVNRVRQNRIDFNPDVAQASYQCLTCRACTEFCELKVEVPEILRRVRHNAIRQEIVPKEIHGFLEKFHRHNNPFSKDLLQHLKKLLPKRRFNKKNHTVYLAGCTATAKAPDIITDTFELFDKLGIDFVSCYDDTIQCCGHPLHVLGARDEFIDLAEINYNVLKNYKLVIVGSPACAHTLKSVYAKYDFDLSDKIITINHFLEPYLKNVNFKIKKGIHTKVMYHDPCYLSRHLGETELPRTLISQVSGYAPIEFQENRHCNKCSGQGGCFSVTNKETAKDLTRSRLEEVHEKKVKTLLTQCPTCVFKMRHNAKRIVVKDVVSYLNDCIMGEVKRGGGLSL